jgi:RNA polymerase sigma-70 factor (ECF subfamily)
MAVRLAVSALGRRQSADGRRSLGNVSETQLDSDAGEVVAYRTLVNELQTEAIKSGLIELSDRTRYIFLLHRYRGLSRSRIAEHLGLPATVVDSHIDEAMGSIKHAVSEFSALGVSWRQGH